MTILIQGLLSVAVMLSALHARAESFDGGMSGGGGNSTPGSIVSADDIKHALWSSRLELYLYFNRLSLDENVNDSLMGTLKDKILPIIEKTAIHASAEGCKDKAGTAKDGSIYSPHANAICISVPSAVEKLRSDNVKIQLLALVAHEYSHLAGLGETDAKAVQNWVLKSFSQGAGDSSGQLQEIENALWRIQDIDSKAKDAANWNALCFYAEKVNAEFSTLDALGISENFSFYDLKSKKRFVSHYLKARLLVAATCGWADYHPDSQRYKKNYQAVFGSHSELLDSVLEGTYWGTKGFVEGDVMIKKVVTIEDGKREFAGLAEYAKLNQQRVEDVEKLRCEPLQ